MLGISSWGATQSAFCAAKLPSQRQSPRAEIPAQVRRSLARAAESLARVKKAGPFLT